jgi:hypothetical protein
MFGYANRTGSESARSRFTSGGGGVLNVGSTLGIASGYLSLSRIHTTAHIAGGNAASVTRKLIYFQAKAGGGVMISPDNCPAEEAAYRNALERLRLAEAVVEAAIRCLEENYMGLPATEFPGPPTQLVVYLKQALVAVGEK